MWLSADLMGRQFYTSELAQACPAGLWENPLRIVSEIKHWCLKIEIHSWKGICYSSKFVTHWVMLLYTNPVTSSLLDRVETVQIICINFTSIRCKKCEHIHLYSCTHFFLNPTSYCSRHSMFVIKTGETTVEK